jgi:hypothetical protein
VREIKLDTLGIILKLSKASQEELFILIKKSRIIDNIIINNKIFKNINDRRNYNKRIKFIKELNLLKEVKIKLDKNSKYYPYLMLNPEFFPTPNKRLSRLLWSGY